MTERRPANSQGVTVRAGTSQPPAEVAKGKVRESVTTTGNRKLFLLSWKAVEISRIPCNIRRARTQPTLHAGRCCIRNFRYWGRVKRRLSRCWRRGSDVSSRQARQIPLYICSSSREVITVCSQQAPKLHSLTRGCYIRYTTGEPMRIIECNRCTV